MSAALRGKFGFFFLFVVPALAIWTCVGVALYAMHEWPTQGPLPAVMHPQLFVVLAPQVPDPNHEGHKMRPDGQTCKPTGDDACHCAIRVCTEDEQGNVTDYDMTSACQWFCKKSSCSCHPCLDECPKDGSAAK